MDDKLLIDQPISHLDLSKDFVKVSQEMGFLTIGDIIAVEPVELIARKGFDYNWFGELVKFLSTHQLLHLLQPLPGNSRG